MSELLPGSEEVAFVDLPAAAEAAIATIVIVAPRERLREAADALKVSATSGGVRLILIAADSDVAPAVRAGAGGILLDGLKPEHFNNAVAALRYSSLPTLVWWRGGSPDVLPGLAALADRLVLDAEDPGRVWRMVPQLSELTAVTDVRWARLTRWRALLAHFFDIPSVREAAGDFRSLHVRAADVHAGRLFAAWVASSLRPEGTIAMSVEEVAEAPAGAPALQDVRLGNGGAHLTLRLATSSTCVISAVEGTGADSSQIVSLGDQSLAAVIAEELRIRSRDVMFERSIRTMEKTDDLA